MIRLIGFTILLLLALAGVPLFSNVYERKRDDLFDNEIKIEQTEKKVDKSELPMDHELK